MANEDAKARFLAEYGKHPFEMTRCEYRDVILDRDPFQLVNMPEWLDAHRKAVEVAIEEGRSIPYAVQVDYPEFNMPTLSAHAAKATAVFAQLRDILPTVAVGTSRRPPAQADYDAGMQVGRVLMVKTPEGRLLSSTNGSLWYDTKRSEAEAAVAAFAA